MNFKLFASVFVGLVAINLSVQSPTVKDDDLKDLVVLILNQLLNESTVLLGEANAAVDYIDQNQDAIRDQIVAWTSGIGKDINAKILEAIDELRDGATDDGKAVLDCIEGEQDKTEAAFEQIYGDIGNCIASETPKVLDEVRKVLGQLNDLEVDVQGQTDTLGACTDEDATCFAALLGSLIETLQKIPTVVTEDVQDIIALVQTIVADVIDCGGDVVKEFKADAQDIFNDAVVCIKQ